MAGQGSEAPARKCFHRWLKRWVEDGVLVLGGLALEGIKNRRTATYLTTPIPPSRVGCEKECPLSLVAPNPSGGDNFTRDTGADDVPRVPREEPSFTRDNPESPRERVPRDFPVVAIDLVPRGTKDTISDTDIARTSESRDETPHLSPRGRWPYKKRPSTGEAIRRGGQLPSKRLRQVLAARLGWGRASRSRGEEVLGSSFR